MAIAKKRKKFFDVDIPLINKQTHLQAYDIKEIDGKLIKYDLTRILRGKSMLMQLRVSVKGDKATTTPRETKILPYFLKRVVRKGTNYVEDSFETPCKDGNLRIKPFLVTRRKVSRAVRKALREKARELIIEYVKTKNSLEIFEDLLKNQFQKSLSLRLKKIYPLSLCEIRVLKFREKTKE